jgi:phage terminase large subunit-like protein
MAGVLDGTVPTCQLTRQAVQRHMADLEHGHERGLYFERAAAEYVLRFFGFLRHSKGEWAGQPFTPTPWQQFIIWVLFGWKRADGTRRFRTAYIEVPRKNGKTTLIAGIGLYLMEADREPGAEVYSAATKRDQALLAHSEATRMVKQSPALRGRVRVFKNNLNDPATASKYEPLGADVDGMDGLNVHAALIDELHAHKTRQMVDILDTATGARRQPLIIEITTAGSDQASICHEHHEYSRRVLGGNVQDDSWFTFIATLDDGDDWTNPAVWAKANPNLGVSVKMDDLQRKAERAKRLPAAQNIFRRLHLNEWTQQSNRWIDLALWDENAGSPDEVALEGCECYGGLDLSAVSDLTAWVMVFPQAEDPDTVDIVARFWCPAAKLNDETNRYMDQYRAWAAQGWLQTTEGDAIDYGVIRQAVLDDAQRFNLRSLNVDRLFQGYQLSQELADEGLEVYGMGQGFLSMAAPMKELERRLLEKKLHHGGNPVLRFMADSVVVSMDAAGNLKPDKAKSQARIDGIVGLVMALDRAMRREPPKRSVYEDRGLEVV